MDIIMNQLHLQKSNQCMKLSLAKKPLSQLMQSLYRSFNMEIIPEKFICIHCNQDIRIRNPSGFCDHLYYPDCCLKCQILIKHKAIITNQQANPVDQILTFAV